MTRSREGSSVSVGLARFCKLCGGDSDPSCFIGGPVGPSDAILPFSPSSRREQGLPASRARPLHGPRAPRGARRARSGYHRLPVVVEVRCLLPIDGERPQRRSTVQGAIRTRLDYTRARAGSLRRRGKAFGSPACRDYRITVSGGRRSCRRSSPTSIFISRRP